MLEFFVGVILAAAVAIVYLIWFNNKNVERRVKAEVDAARLTMAQERVRAANRILQENTGDGPAWRKRMAQRLLDQDNG